MAEAAAPPWPAAGRRRGRRRWAAAAAVLSGAAVAGPLLWSPVSTFVVPPAADAAAAHGADVAAELWAQAAAASVASESFGDISQLLLAAQQPQPFVSEFEKFGPDPFFFFYIITALIILAATFYVCTKPFWENRWLVEKINKQKLMFITQEEKATALDRYDLARMYIALEDIPAAIAEFEEVEEEFGSVRNVLDPDDTMGALASRAKLHNSKGFSLMKLEPPRRAQARREFVRAVTYWPEYPEALLNIGTELIKRKRYDVASRTLNTALKWQPGSEVMQQAAKKARDLLDGDSDSDEE